MNLSNIKPFVEAAKPPRPSSDASIYSPSAATTLSLSKMPKEVAPRQSRRHNPLHDDLVENDSGNLRRIARSKRKEKHEKFENYVDSGLSKRILKIARDQQDELHEEEAEEATARGEFFGSAAQMRFQDEEESDEDEYEESNFGEDDTVEEVVCPLHVPIGDPVLTTNRKLMKEI